MVKTPKQHDFYKKKDPSLTVKVIYHHGRIISKWKLVFELQAMVVKVYLEIHEGNFYFSKKTVLYHRITGKYYEQNQDLKHAHSHWTLF